MFSVPIRGYGREEGGAEAHAVSSSVSQGLSRRTASIRKATYDLSTGSQNYWLDQCSDLYDTHEDFRDVFGEELCVFSGNCACGWRAYDLYQFL